MHVFNLISYIFLFYVGFYFFRLAENHKRNKWLFSLIGIITFFVGYFSYIFYYRIFRQVEIVDFSIIAIRLKSFFSGLIFVVIEFHLLDFIWSKKKRKKKEEIDKIGEK